MKAAVDAAKASIGWNPKAPLHFKDAKLDRRECVLAALSRDRSLFRAISVIVYKPYLADTEAFGQDNRLYFYFARYVLERISWLCRGTREYEAREHGDGTARVIFSCMNEVSRSRFESYMQKLTTLDTEVDWSVLRPTQLETLSSGKHAGLQIADAVAGAFYCADHPCRKNKTERWVEMLRPLMYRSKRGKYRGYGVKLCPPEVENQNAQDALAPWALRVFPE